MPLLAVLGNRRRSRRNVPTPRGSAYPLKRIAGPIRWESMSKTQKLQLQRQFLYGGMPYDPSGTYWVLQQYPKQVGGHRLWHRVQSTGTNGSCCRNPGRCRHNNPMIPMIAGGMAAGVAGAVANHFLSNPRGPLNDREREMWVSNDEGLYRWWRSSRLSMRAFIKANRAELDAAILGALNRKPLRNSGATSPTKKSSLPAGVGKDGVLYKVARKSASGEWTVTAYVPDGKFGWKRHEGKTYYADSKEDAIGTFNYIMGPKGPTMMNPLTRREAAKELLVARRVYRRGVEYPKGSQRRKFLLGRASGMAAVVTDTAQGHRTRYIAAGMESKAYARQNPGSEQNVINLPFRAGRKYSVAQVQKWVEAHGTPAMKKRFALAMSQYRRFHKGSLPKFITYSQYKMGSHPGISDVEFGVSEGHEWMAAYQVPRSSGKWVDKASGGRYVHAHGDSDIDVDVKRPVKLSKLPMRFHTPDGKAVGVIPSKNVKIGEWYEG